MRRRDHALPHDPLRRRAAPADLLQRIAQGDKDLGGLSGRGLPRRPTSPLNEAIVRSWNRLVGAWASFREAEQALPEDDPGDHGHPRALAARPLRRARLRAAADREGGRDRGQGVPRLSCLGARADPPRGLPRPARSPLARGRRRRRAEPARPRAGAPEPLRGAPLGLRLERPRAPPAPGQLLADPAGLPRVRPRADDGVGGLLGLRPALARLPRLARRGRATARVLARALVAGGGAARERARSDSARRGRGGDRRARGGLPRPSGERRAARGAPRGELSTQDYYRELLRLVYRLLFLFVAEDRGLLHRPRGADPSASATRAGTRPAAPRALAERRAGRKHADLYEALKLVMGALGDDEGGPRSACPPSGASSGRERDPASRRRSRSRTATCSRRFARSRLRRATGACCARSTTSNLGAEELGSVYESLLELHPELNADAGTFSLTTAAGNERKTTGSYYTPTSLISLLDSALDPVLEEASGQGRGGDPRPEGVRSRLRLGPLPRRRRPPDRQAPRLRAHGRRGALARGDPRRPPRRRLPLPLRRRRQPDGGRALQGLALDGGARPRPAALLPRRARQVRQLAPRDDARPPQRGHPRRGLQGARGRRQGGREGAPQAEQGRSARASSPFEDLAGGLVDSLETEAEALDDAATTRPRRCARRSAASPSFVQSEAYERARLAMDAWCAAFVQRKVEGRAADHDRRRPAHRSGTAQHARQRSPTRCAGSRAEYGFFQWEVEYPAGLRARGRRLRRRARQPAVGAREAARRRSSSPAIRRSRRANAAARKRLIAALEQDDPPLYASWLAALRKSDGRAIFVRTAAAIRSAAEATSTRTRSSPS